MRKKQKVRKAIYWLGAVNILIWGYAGFYLKEIDLNGRHFIRLHEETARPLHLPQEQPKDPASLRILSNLPIPKTIIAVAKEENFEDIENLLKLAQCESGFNPSSLNPTNNSYDRGTFQISRKWHPEVSDEQAYDIKYATRWTIGKIRAGQLKQWCCKGVCDNQEYKLKV